MRKHGYSSNLLAAAAGVFLLVQGQHALAGPWDMDTTFGDGGLVTYVPDSGIQVIVLADGSLLEVTTAANGVTLRHRDGNGKLDTSFGVAGKLEISFPAGFGTYDVIPLVDSSGRLLWCGAMDTNNDKIQDLAILRYTTAGALDAGFGSGGVVSQVSARFAAPNNGAYGDRCDSMAIQPDGRIVAAIARYDGYYDDALTQTLLRFNPDGSPDTTFGSGTGAISVPSQYYEGGSNVQMLPNGWIMVNGGARESTFDAGGSLVIGPKDNPDLPGSSYAYSDPIEWQVLGISGTGDMLLVGIDNGTDVLVAREHSDGSIDRNFGSGAGYVQVDAGPFIAGTSYRFATASLSRDGQRLYIVRHSYSFNGEPGDGEVVRLIASGSGAGRFDPGFGLGGRVAWPFPGFEVIEQSPGAVVLNGPGRALRLAEAAGPSPGILGFTNGGSASGAETTSLVVRVVRAAGHDGVATVAYRTADHSAKAGVNYESTQGLLQWANGDAADKKITLNLQKGTSTVLPEFSLLLDQPQGALLLANEVVVGVKGTSPAPAPAPAPVVPLATPTNVNQVTSGGGSTDPLTLMLLLLGGGAALRARVRSNRS